MSTATPPPRPVASPSAEAEEEDDATILRRAIDLLDLADEQQEATGEIDHLSRLAWVNTFARRLLRLARIAAEPGRDGYLWQLWEYDADVIMLQRLCDVEGCEKGLLHTPARNCSRCQGSGFLTRRFKLYEKGVRG